MQATSVGTNEANTCSEPALRVVFIEGPGNVVGSFRAWKSGKDDLHQASVTYSAQFFDACVAANAEALVIASHSEEDSESDDRIHVTHRSIPWSDRGGLRYHLGQIWYGLYLIQQCRHFKADLAVVTTGTHWFMLSLLAYIGISPVPALFCVLWPKHRHSGRIQRMVLRMARGLFRRHSFAILSMSNDITAQIDTLTQDRSAPVIEFLPLYRPEITRLPEPNRNQHEFRVLFAGRIETNKGVFDLLDVAKRCSKNEDIVFDVCGNGSKLEQLRAECRRAGLSRTFRCHGYCYQEELHEFIGSSHAFIVPTTSDFIEGFNMVVCEAVLAGRPVITSTVCPALNYVRDAIAEVAPDDIDSYTRAVLSLYEDRDRYDTLQQATLRYRAQFLDPDKSFGDALLRVMRAFRSGTSPRTRRIPIGCQSTH